MTSLNCMKRLIDSGPTMPETTTKCSRCDGHGRVADPDHGHGRQCEPCNGSGILILGYGEDGLAGQRPGQTPQEVQKCPACDGEGIFEDPQHGQSMKCLTCRGTGLVPRAVCEVHQCQRCVLPRRKICENHAFPGARPPATTGRRAAVLATRKKWEEEEEAKVSEGLTDREDEEVLP